MNTYHCSQLLRPVTDSETSKTKLKSGIRWPEVYLEILLMTRYWKTDTYKSLYLYRPYFAHLEQRKAGLDGHYNFLSHYFQEEKFRNFKLSSVQILLRSTSVKNLTNLEKNRSFRAIGNMSFKWHFNVILKYLFLSNISTKHFLPPYTNFNILHLKNSITETLKLNQRLTICINKTSRTQNRKKCYIVTIPLSFLGSQILSTMAI